MSSGLLARLEIAIGEKQRLQVLLDQCKDEPSVTGQIMLWALTVSGVLCLIGFLAWGALLMWVDVEPIIKNILSSRKETD